MDNLLPLNLGYPPVGLYYQTPSTPPGPFAYSLYDTKRAQMSINFCATIKIYFNAAKKVVDRLNSFIVIKINIDGNYFSFS